MRPSYLYHGDPYTGKTAPLHGPRFPQTYIMTDLISLFHLKNKH